MPSPEKPPFAPADSALIYVPYRGTTMLKGGVLGGGLIALAVVNLARTASAGAMVLHGAIGLLGLIMFAFGIAAAFRRSPVFTADADGITASMAGFDRTRLPWELVSGADVVGKKKTERMLVILTHDPEAALGHVDKVARPAVQKNNAKYRVSGAFYIQAVSMRVPAESVAEQIRDLVAVQEGVEAAAV